MSFEGLWYLKTEASIRGGTELRTVVSAHWHMAITILELIRNNIMRLKANITSA